MINDCKNAGPVSISSLLYFFQEVNCDHQLAKFKDGKHCSVCDREIANLLTSHLTICEICFESHHSNCSSSFTENETLQFYWCNNCIIKHGVRFSNIVEMKMTAIRQYKVIFEGTNFFYLRVLDQLDSKSVFYKLLCKPAFLRAESNFLSSPGNISKSLPNELSFNILREESVFHYDESFICNSIINFNSIISDIRFVQKYLSTIYYFNNRNQSFFPTIIVYDQDTCLNNFLADLEFLILDYTLFIARTPEDVIKLIFTSFFRFKFQKVKNTLYKINVNENGNPPFGFHYNECCLHMNQIYAMSTELYEFFVSYMKEFTFMKEKELKLFLLHIRLNSNNQSLTITEDRLSIRTIAVINQDTEIFLKCKSLSRFIFNHEFCKHKVYIRVNSLIEEQKYQSIFHLPQNENDVRTLLINSMSILKSNNPSVDIKSCFSLIIKYATSNGLHLNSSLIENNIDTAVSLMKSNKTLGQLSKEDIRYFLEIVVLLLQSEFMFTESLQDDQTDIVKLFVGNNYSPLIQSVILNECIRKFITSNENLKKNLFKSLGIILIANINRWKASEFQLAKSCKDYEKSLGSYIEILLNVNLVNGQLSLKNSEKWFDAFRVYDKTFFYFTNLIDMKESFHYAFLTGQTLQKYKPSACVSLDELIDLMKRLNAALKSLLGLSTKFSIRSKLIN